MKNKTTKTEWEYVPGFLGGGGNYVLDCKGFYISYNPMPGSGLSFFESDDGGSETALCKDHKFYILNGDYRKDYEKLISKGYMACKKFFNSKKKENPELVSSWSN